MLQTDIINYPNNLQFYLYGFILIILALKNNKLILDVIIVDKGIKKLLGISYLLITGFVTSLVFSHIALLVLNIYLTYECKANPINNVKCNINQVINHPRNQKIYYYFQGNLNLTYGYIPIMKEIANNPKLTNQYKFIANVRKGVFDTYLLESWTIQKDN